MTLNIILGFTRFISRIFAKLFRLGSVNARTAGKSGTGFAAKQVHEDEAAEDENPDNTEPNSSEEGLPYPTSEGIESRIFTQLSRPRLSERTAADLDLEEAREHMQQADVFYSYPFDLFARGDFFYEEVEEEFLNHALGLNRNSIDERFLKIVNMFRRTLNDNTRLLMVLLAPVILLAILTFITIMSVSNTNILSVLPASASDNILLDISNSLGIKPTLLIPFLSFTLGGIVAFLLMLLLFSWPFKVSQQRNLLNLDNYLTSKFSRINNNFQVAKRRALNVERNKRMSQIDELKEEAGTWTMSYQWFAMRLLLCEMMIRNRLYQVRRNTVLYWIAGISLCVLVTFLMAGGVYITLPDHRHLPLAILLGGFLYVLLTFTTLQRTSRIMITVLEANEWSRFHLLNLHKTIQDHVGEDKVQIVTFRDRNRME